MGIIAPFLSRIYFLICLNSILNDALYLGLYESAHKCTSHTLLTHGQFTGAIWNSLFLTLYKSVDNCTSPLVEHLPCMVDPCKKTKQKKCMQCRTAPSFKGYTSWATSPSVEHLPCMTNPCMQSETTIHF